MVPQHKLKMVSDLTNRVKNLVIEKGFSLGIKSYQEKVALLNTEISELCDAYKKGFGDEKMGEEISDIVIRLLNIPAMYDLDMSNISSQCYQIFYSYKSKGVMYDAESDGMWQYFNRLSFYTNFFYTIYVDNPVPMKLGKLPDLLMNDLRALVYVIILLCEDVADILHIDLWDCIEKKMDVNINRPFRHNTDPNLFKNDTVKFPDSYVLKRDPKDRVTVIFDTAADLQGVGTKSVLEWVKGKMITSPEGTGEPGVAAYNIIHKVHKTINKE